ncbi:hypothetical protein IscW_ISCW022809 [Ixodes scapularis]|uniref:Uncharacterized protein n=1 Tax=Ixodes scapularis TaxID=6945 RepID=B7QET4_IXOSC|nr:hypothetical protein IscW_ISCW022809 [Ixodes scapularis]|eukprot:XP_002414048.1 hypothetical protein IscW_ISCW022809 [Ixodes scapularis]
MLEDVRPRSPDMPVCRRRRSWAGLSVVGAARSTSARASCMARAARRSRTPQRDVAARVVWAAGAARIEGRPPLGGRPSARKPRRPGSAHAHGDSPEAPGPAQKRARAADRAPHGARGPETRGSRSGNGTSGPRSRALAGRGRQRALADSVRTAERHVCSERERGSMPAAERYHSEICSL